jgi:hypothetical protein
VSLGNYTALPKGYAQDDLKATLSNDAGGTLAAKYTIGPMNLRRLRILPAVRPQQHLSERLQEPRRVQRVAWGDHVQRLCN